MTITKTQILTAIAAIADTIDPNSIAPVTIDEIKEYATTTISQLESKSKKDRVRLAAKRGTDDDALKEEILSLLTAEGQSIPQIADQLSISASPNKISARLKKLVDAGLVTKDRQRIGESSVTYYSIAHTGDN